ncbi:UDP-glycosyltransferase 83A1-like [Prosopis cineraria]|uniref:UDP-glycosyltransferase 83A1-like n=1 Tax=Prosopis cineraria TaxID=364024 RepID=UPI00240F98EF|nr:UDP-glycosyltransferase 83A1-like [Prosopis cineraria]
MGIPHFLVIPFPTQGHLNPSMQFSHALAKNGCNITFLSTEFNHNKVLMLKAAAASSDHHQDNLLGSKIKLVSFPDGLDPEDERRDLQKLLFSIRNTMPSRLPKLIHEINALEGNNNNYITCIVVTINMGWAFEVGSSLGIKGALLWPASATSLTLCDSIHSFIDDGVVDSEYGLPVKTQKIQLSPDMPLMDPKDLPWCSLGKVYFEHLKQEIKTCKLSAQWWLCNTVYELEPVAFSSSPKLLPIGGPMLTSSDHNPTSFWEEDKTCLHWLDQQPSQSVIYVSFGSWSLLDQNQFTELALGLQLLNMPFLWVVRPGNDEKHAYPDGFMGCISNKGKIVGWAPQKMVLKHHAIACFISHCGWNSTVEGLHGGVPFLCWPFRNDQFVNKFFICEVWKAGLGLHKHENGVISRDEIKKKVEQLLGCEDIKARCLKWKEIVMESMEKEDSQSIRNFQNFIKWTKE